MNVNTYTHLSTEAMPNGSLQSFVEINPLVGLPPRTLRLYSALEMLKKRYRSAEKPVWFPVSRSDPFFERIGFSKADIEIGLEDLLQADLLEIRESAGAMWYCLK